MKCDICGEWVPEEDSFIVLPEQIVQARDKGYIPTRLPDSWKSDSVTPAEKVKVQWHLVVDENALVDWLLCPSCHLELIQHQKAQSSVSF